MPQEIFDSSREEKRQIKAVLGRVGYLMRENGKL